MATTTLKMTEKNTTPPFQLTCERKTTAGVEVIDLTSATLVELIISKGGTQTNAGHEDCTIIDATNGVIEYSPQATDFEGASNFICDVQITYGDGTNEVLYEQQKIKTRRRLSRS